MCLASPRPLTCLSTRHATRARRSSGSAKTTSAVAEPSGVAARPASCFATRPRRRSACVARFVRFEASPRASCASATSDARPGRADADSGSPSESSSSESPRRASRRVRTRAASRTSAPRASMTPESSMYSTRACFASKRGCFASKRFRFFFDFLSSFFPPFDSFDLAPPQSASAPRSDRTKPSRCSTRCKSPLPTKTRMHVKRSEFECKRSIRAPRLSSTRTSAALPCTLARTTPQRPSPQRATRPGCSQAAPCLAAICRSARRQVRASFRRRAPSPERFAAS
mmetsp:Transcript_22213/g.76970  ORF Transcript_22213/g.76970 Transcript_22213/m.76970 type:complete len:284 (+) Transcript_22213:488-1339(+)